MQCLFSHLILVCREEPGKFPILSIELIKKSFASEEDLRKDAEIGLSEESFKE